MIYVITHKKFDTGITLDEHYRILHVGENKDCSESYLRDDTGINISHKNANFCELTGLFWIWKNGKEKPDDITGMVHYRRFFTNRRGDLLYTYINRMPSLISYEIIKRKLQHNDMILPRQERIFRTVYQSYADLHCAEDLKITRQVIRKVEEDYLPAFDYVMASHSYYFANMMICKKATLDAYSKWLFDIMNGLEKEIDISKYHDNYQKRVYGFLAERLLKVWVVHNHIKVWETPVFNTDEKRINIIQKNCNRIKKALKITEVRKVDCGSR